MFEKLQVFFFQIGYLFSHMDAGDYLDILLVTSLFFIAFQALYQTRALQLLRGVIIYAVFGVVLFLTLPQSTFKYLVLALLLMGAIALPWLFQDELRRALTSLGRFGSRRVYSSSFDRFKEIIISVTQELVERGEGALIVLESRNPLDDVIQTGVPIQAQTVTSELLLSIFQDGSPLHDGAAVLSGDRLIAAGCILPVSTVEAGSKRIGTRHRAALGLSILVSDTLVIVVSEELRAISVAMNGRLYRNLSPERLNRWLDRFQDHIAGDDRSRWDWIKGGGLRSSLINLGLALGLAVFTWMAVSLNTNPPVNVEFEVDLKVLPPDPDLVVQSEIPTQVSASIWSTSDRIGKINPDDLEAELDLEGLASGSHPVPVSMLIDEERTQIVSIDPELVDVVLEPIITLQVTPEITLTGQDGLPFGYEVGEVESPEKSVTVRGPQSELERLSQVKGQVDIQDRREDFRGQIKLIPLDADGKPLVGIMVEPENIPVTVPIEQTIKTRDIPVMADVRAETLPEDYEISAIRLSNPSITLIGEDFALDEVGDFVFTAPISLTNAAGQVSYPDIPLLLPPGVTAVDENGANINTVEVEISVEPVSNYLPVSVTPSLRGLSEDLTAKVDPPQVSLLLIGPQFILDEITRDEGLLAVYLDVDGLGPGIYKLPVLYEIPAGLTAQVFPSEVEVELVLSEGG